jgi:WD40 repeat protein
MAVDPELKRAAFWNESSLVEVNTADGKATAALPGFARPLRDVAWDSRGSLLAATDEEGDTVVYDPSEKRVAAIYRGEVKSVIFLGQGQWILCAGADRRIRIWPARAPDRDHFVGHDGRIVALAAQPRGRLVATGDTLGSIRLWDIISGKAVRTLGLHVAVKGPPGTPESETLRSIRATHALRQRIFFSPADGGAYTPSSLREGWVFEGHEGEIRSFSFSPDGTRLASAGVDGRVRIWQVSNGRELARLRHPTLTSGVAFAPDGNHLATACWDSVVRIWDSRKGTEQVRCVGHADKVSAVVFDHDGRRLYSGGMDRVVRVWDAASGKQLNTLAGHTDWIHALAMSPDGRMLASASEDQTIRLWDLSTGQTRWTLVGHTQRVTGLAFHPTDPRLVSASNHDEDGTVRIWDVGTGQEIVSLETPANNVKDLGFDSAGKQLVLTVGKQLDLWQAFDPRSLREVSPKRTEPRRTPVRLEPTAAIKVLGVMKPDQLPVMNAQGTWKPSHGAKQFYVVVAAVSHDLLYPNDKQYKTLQEKAAQDSSERPAGPPASYALFDPQRFTLWLENGQKIKASLIGPLPFAREMGGFNTSVIVETSTSTFPPADRSLVAIAWDTASEPQGPLRLQIDGRDPVAVPAFELKNYQGSPNARGAAASDLLMRQSEYSEL